MQRKPKPKPDTPGTAPELAALQAQYFANLIESDGWELKWACYGIVGFPEWDNPVCYPPGMGKLLDQARLAIGAGVLYGGINPARPMVKPREFVAWAARKGVEIPGPLRMLLKPDATAPTPDTPGAGLTDLQERLLEDLTAQAYTAPAMVEHLKHGPMKRSLKTVKNAFDVLIGKGFVTNTRGKGYELTIEGRRVAQRLLGAT